MSADTFFFVCASGFVLGGLYALMATGLAVVWTTLGVFNFAHGAFLALGAYVAWQVSDGGGGPATFLLAACVSAAVLFCLGYVSHFALVKPFERKQNMVLLSVVTTLAAAAIIENAILLIWGPRDKQVPAAIEGSFELFGSALRYQDLLAVVTALAALVVLATFLRRTTTGRSMRAVAQNREAAELMGLRTSHLFALTIGISTAMAALAGVFIGSLRFMNPSFGADPLMKSLIVVILGGVARFTSPIAAAFVVGLVEAFSTFFLGLYWTPAVLFSMMIAVLLVKPEGLFSRRTKTL